MKSFIKRKSKKGFTLVEVMLSVAIMAIASLMIMEGFMATMNLAQNSSVYGKIGGSNYQAAAGKVSQYASMPVSDTSEDGRYAQLMADTSVNENHIILIQPGVPGIGNLSYGTVGWHFYGSTSPDAGKINRIDAETESYAGSFGSSAANRTTFFYVNALQCENEDCPYHEHYGCVRYGTRSGHPGWYCSYCEELVAEA